MSYPAVQGPFGVVCGWLFELSNGALSEMSAFIFQKDFAAPKAATLIIAALSLLPAPAASASASERRPKAPASVRTEKAKRKHQRAATANASTRSSPRQQAPLRRSFEAGASMAAWGLGLGVPAYGGEVSYLSSKRLHFGITALYGTLDLKDAIEPQSAPSTGGDKERVVSVERASVTAIGTIGTVKYLVTQSLYLAPSFAMRHAVLDMSIKDASGNGVEVSTQSQSFTAGFGFGNIWRPDEGLYIGAEWLSYHVPIYGTHSSQTTSYGDAEQEHDALVEIADDTARTIAQSSFLNALTLRIGLAF